MTTPLRPLPHGSVVPLSGVSFRQEAVKACRVGQELLLRHDVTNVQDRWAVAATTLDGQDLGFVTTKADLAHRLSMNVPGGTWQGFVAEVLNGGETTGLRVRVGDLLRVGDSRPGSDRPGARWTDDSDLEPAAAGCPATTPESPLPALGAFGLGGAFLGVVESVGDVVRVLGADGQIRAYPAPLVTLKELQPA